MELAASLEARAGSHGGPAIDDTEIVERCLLALVNEGTAVLGDGIAATPTRRRPSRHPPGAPGIDLHWLAKWGALRVPGHLWRALTRFGAWIEPMLVSEWARLIRSYADRMGLEILPGVPEASLEWREPARSTSLARLTQVT